jgi:hypothetical protein
LDHDASSFSGSLEYSVQPTDDNTKLIAETTAGDALMSVLTELSSTYLLSDQIRSAKIEADKAAAAQASEQAAAAQASTAAQQQLNQADLDEAANNNKLAAQQIAAVWKNIPQSNRVQMWPGQNAWNKKITAQCTINAAGISVDPVVMRAAKLRCETDAINQRIKELEQYTSYSTNDQAVANGGEEGY